MEEIKQNARDHNANGDTPTGEYEKARERGEGDQELHTNSSKNKANAEDMSCKTLG